MPLFPVGVAIVTPIPKQARKSRRLAYLIHLMLLLLFLDLLVASLVHQFRAAIGVPSRSRIEEIISTTLARYLDDIFQQAWRTWGSPG